MSFLDNVKANKPGIGGGVNPFATSGGTKMTNSTNNPFAPKGTPAPAAPFNIAVAPGAVPSKPAAPIGKPSFPGVPKAPGMAVPKPGAVPAPVKPATSPTPAPVEAKADTKEEVKEKAKEVSTEEMIKDIKETKVEEPTAAQAETKKEAVEEKKATKAKAETKKETKTKSRKTSTRKKAEEATTKEVVDTPEVTETIETLFKMPTTSIKYSEAIQAIKSKFVDEEWENFRKEVIEESDKIVIESDMQEGAMKKTIAKLNALREKIWVNFVDTKSLFESLSNKDTEGLIERVKFASLEGANETIRKKAGVLAVMNYVTPEGENVNLYEVYDETKNRFYFLKSVMDTIKYKSDVLITMSSAIKMEKSHSNN
jgi:hypothetical protein